MRSLLAQQRVRGEEQRVAGVDGLGQARAQAAGGGDGVAVDRERRLAARVDGDERDRRRGPRRATRTSRAPRPRPRGGRAASAPQASSPAPPASATSAPRRAAVTAALATSPPNRGTNASACGERVDRALADEVDDRLSEAEGPHRAERYPPALSCRGDRAHDGLVGDCQVFWRRPRRRRARPILYLHGVPTDGDDWLPFLEQTGGLAPTCRAWPQRQARRPGLLDGGARPVRRGVRGRPRAGPRAPGRARLGLGRAALRDARPGADRAPRDHQRGAAAAGLPLAPHRPDLAPARPRRAVHGRHVAAHARPARARPEAARPSRRRAIRPGHAARRAAPATAVRRSTPWLAPASSWAGSRARRWSSGARAIRTSRRASRTPMPMPCPTPPRA